MNNIYTKGGILLLSGPSGCGKSSLLKELYKAIDNYYFSISTTTREPRIGEVDGVDYYFVTQKAFQEDIKKKNFLEWAEVHGNYYGTSSTFINEALKASKLVIFDIDVQGFEQVIKKFKNITTTVFITTPTINELKKRLYNRNTDKKSVIEKRISNAILEINYFDKYDYFIINDNLEIASQQLISIARSSLVKVSLYNKYEIIKNWKNI